MTLHKIKKECSLLRSCLMGARRMLCFTAEQVFLPMSEVWLMPNCKIRRAQQRGGKKPRDYLENIADHRHGEVPREEQTAQRNAALCPNFLSFSAKHFRRLLLGLNSMVSNRSTFITTNSSTHLKSNSVNCKSY